MLEIILAGGWLMLPIMMCSIIAMCISIERFWALRPDKIAPKQAFNEVWQSIQEKQLNNQKLEALKKNSPLGKILAAGLTNSKFGRDIMKESIELEASHVVHEMEKYLNALGIIAVITPLLGLLGTVIGMIDVFTAIMEQGTGNAGVLAGGISQALITTAAGLSVAIPSLVLYRLFQRKIEAIVVTMEQEAMKLMDVIFAGRKVESEPQTNTEK